MPRILHKLRIDEISHVDRGAGEGVKVVLMKRDNDAPPQGSVREKLQFLIEQLRRGYPDMPVRQARAEAWNALSDDEQVEILREERQMNKLDNSTLFDDWYRQLTPEQRQEYQRRQRAIDAEMADEGTSSRDSEGHGGGQFNGRPKSPNIAPNAPKAPTFAKGDTLQSIAKEFGIAALAQHITEDGARGISADEFTDLVRADAEARGTTFEKAFCGTDKAAISLRAAHKRCRDEGWGLVARKSSALVELEVKARELCEANPKLSKAQAFAKVYEDPRNRELARRERAERI
jgi:hypothetical protein